MSLATNVKIARKQLGFTQKELAQRAGISQSFISQLEHGLYIPTVISADRLAKALNTTIDELVNERRENK